MHLAPVSDISERLAEPSAKPAPQRMIETAGRFAESVIMTLFAVIGYIAGGFFRVCFMSWIALDYGFRAGAGWPQRQPPDDEEPPGE